MIPDLQLLKVYFALYDSLVDDDEDVRNQGARVASTILSVASSTAAENSTTYLSLSPPAAKKRLLRFLCEDYRTSTLLCVESVSRLTGMDSVLGSSSASMQGEEPQTEHGKSILHFRSVADLSLEARTTSTVVFVEERQNLYIDTVSEAEDWAAVLFWLDTNTWPSSLSSDLETWTVEGLAHILKNLQDNVDGALSPTSKPEVFTLFVRVLQAAKVVIMRSETHYSSKEKWEKHECVGLLEKLLDLGRSRLFHDLLLHRIETILEEVGQSPKSRSGVVAVIEI